MNKLEKVRFWYKPITLQPTIIFGRVTGDPLGHIERVTNGYTIFLRGVSYLTQAERFYELDIVSAVRLYEATGKDIASGAKDDLTMAVDSMLMDFGFYVDHSEIPEPFELHAEELK